MDDWALKTIQDIDNIGALTDEERADMIRRSAAQVYCKNLWNTLDIEQAFQAFVFESSQQFSSNINPFETFKAGFEAGGKW